jgi:hypothetical protein
MASDARSADADGPDKLLRPAWEDTADETEADRFALPRQARATAGWGGGWLDRATLGIAPQTGTALLRTLQGEGVVREVTGRGSFRAFAI